MSHDLHGDAIKICRVCLEELPVTDFYRDVRYEGGRKHLCKSCQNTSRNRRRKERKDWIQTYKLERGCTDCGYAEHPEALQFDHLPIYEKECDIAQLADASKERYLRELEKCEIVCANCHAVRTANRRNKEI